MRCGAATLGIGSVEAYLTVIAIMDMPLFIIAVVYGLLWKRANWQGAIGGYAARARAAEERALGHVRGLVGNLVRVAEYGPHDAAVRLVEVGLRQRHRRGRRGGGMKVGSDSTFPHAKRRTRSPRTGESRV